MKKAFYIFAVIGLVISSAALTLAQIEEKDYKYGVAYSLYDKAKNETTYEIRQLKLLDDTAYWILLNASRTFPGSKIDKRPDFVIFVIQIASDRYKHPDRMQMKVMVDGKAFPDILMLNLDKRPVGKLYLETIGTRMDYDVFKTISQAKSVELQLDATKVSLTSSHLAVLADLEKLMNP